MTCVPAPTPDLGPIIDEIVDVVTEIYNAVRGIFDAINSIFSMLPDFLVGAINDGLDAINSWIQQFGKAIGDILKMVGNPGELSRVGNSWVTDVGGPAVSQAGYLDPALLATSGTWTGSAYEAYKGRTMKQIEAAKELMPRCEHIDAELANVGQSIIMFWIEIGIAVVALVASVLSAAAECATLVGAPLGLATAGAAISIAIEFIAAAVATTSNVVNASNQMIQQIRADIAGSFAFPGGDWPRAVGA